MLENNVLPVLGAIDGGFDIMVGTVVMGLAVAGG